MSGEELKPYERKLAAILLELASNEFANHGSNDFELSRFLSGEEALEICSEFYQDDPDFNPNDPFFQPGDSSLMSFLARKLYPEISTIDLYE